MESKTERMITLLSGDGIKFKVGEEVACEFGMIKMVLEDILNAEAMPLSLPLPNVSGKCLAQILEFTRESVRLRNVAGSGVLGTKENCERAFMEGLNDDDLKEIMMAALYLDNKEVLRMTERDVARRIGNMSVEGVRKFFEMECDFTEEELKKLKDENRWAWVDDD